MARRLPILSILLRLRAPPVFHPVFLIGVRSVRRGAGEGPVPRDGASRRSAFSNEMSDGALNLEDVDDKIQTLLELGKQRQKAVKHHILRRQMTPPGPPQRKLTWEAIEQIRFLQQEQPEEWTIKRLAEGYSVPQDVIRRVLKSKFSPSVERKVKQDAKVMAELGHPMLLDSGTAKVQGRVKLPDGQTMARLSSTVTEDALISVTGPRNKAIQAQTSGTLNKSLTSVTVKPSRLTAGVNKNAAQKMSAVDHGITATQPIEEEECEDSWDGTFLTEEELEKFVNMEKPPAVVQVGKDFFDAQGDFLYRI